jgi:hypothetical protein
MLHACIARIDVMRNLEKILDFWITKQDLKERYELHDILNSCHNFLLSPHYVPTSSKFI